MLLSNFMKKKISVKYFYKLLVQFFFKKIYGRITHDPYQKKNNDIIIDKINSQTIKKKKKNFIKYTYLKKVEFVLIMLKM